MIKRDATGDQPASARHRLAFLDHLAFELFRATGRNQLMQCLWLYDREVDLDALAQTQERLAAMAFNRLIEPSALPGGRPRWVKPAGAPPPVRLGPDRLPRSTLMAWANDQAHLPIHPVTGPAGHLAVQRFDDGSTAVSLVGSHLVLDGMGAIGAITAAAAGTECPTRYGVQGARGWLARCASDARQILADAPRTLAAIARIARTRRPVASAAEREAGRPRQDIKHDPALLVALPAVAVTIESRDWDACEVRLGGRANTLLPGLVAALAARLGRYRPSDGAVSLLVPVNRRHGLDDDRALAIDFHRMVVPSAGLATDLRPVIAPLKALLRAVKDRKTDTITPLLPAIAWMPRRMAMALVNRMFNYADALPVSCSDLGMLPDGMARIDGGPCVRVLTRAVDTHVTRGDLERSHGHLVVVASRHGTTISLCIEAWQHEPANTTIDALRDVTMRLLADFGLNGVIEA